MLKVGIDAGHLACKPAAGRGGSRSHRCGWQGGATSNVNAYRFISEATMASAAIPVQQGSGTGIQYKRWPPPASERHTAW